MQDCHEGIVSTRPFVVRRRVRWADCDPAGVAYTGRFTEYVLDSMMHFMRHIGFGPMGTRAGDDNVGLPMKHVSMTFHVSLFPDDVFDAGIHVGDLGERTFDLHLAARLPDGRVAFEARCVPICILTSERKSTPIPPRLRAILETYREAGSTRI